MNEKRAKKKIAIVEDGEAFRLIFRDLLESQGFEVLEAEDGKKGWELIRNTELDLVLLDLMLPGMNGFQVLAKMQEFEATRVIPVIVVTALEDESFSQKALELGASECLVKGTVTPDQITDKIRQILSR